MEDIDGAEDDISTLVDMRWESEPELDAPTVPEDDYSIPRLVLISSKISWCYSLAGALKRDENVLHIIYDFDKCSFDDILAECRRLLDSHQAGSTARSVLLICKGGPGYLYLLKNFVVTPQKLESGKYTAMAEFWKQLSHVLCDVSSRDAPMHIFGEIIDQSAEGQALKTSLENLLPDRVSVDSVNDSSISGHNFFQLYFDYRKFLLWRSLTEMKFDLSITSSSRD